jgi:hypothetical protein
VLTAISAIAQMATRLVLGAAMRLVGDWVLVLAAGAVLCLSNGVVVASTAFVPFVLAELLQGVARACFWTGSQTHVVRGDAPAVGALATINFVSSLGCSPDPSWPGYWWSIRRERRSGWARPSPRGHRAGAGTRPATTVPPTGRAFPARIWRRSGVDVGCWAGVSAGAWRGLLSSYVPVVLDAARQPASTIGVLVSVASGASVVGSVVVARARYRRMVRAFVFATLATESTGLVALAAEAPWAAAALLAVSGLGAGALQTVGPAIATDSVHPEERGEAIAAAGTFRAAALFAAPLAVAGASRSSGHRRYGVGWRAHRRQRRCRTRSVPPPSRSEGPP